MQQATASSRGRLRSMPPRLLLLRVEMLSRKWEGSITNPPIHLYISPTIPCHQRLIWPSLRICITLPFPSPSPFPSPPSFPFHLPMEACLIKCGAAREGKTRRKQFLSGVAGKTRQILQSSLLLFSFLLLHEPFSPFGPGQL